MRTIQASVRLLAIIVWTCILVPLQMVVIAMKIGRWEGYIPQFFHRGVLMILGVNLIRLGDSNMRGRPCFYVINHCSWLDIIVIGACFHGSFISKDDVQGWPIIGFLCGLQSTVFIARTRPQLIRNQNDSIIACWRQGRSVILFPEGTTNDGSKLLPFKSSLFDSAYQCQALMRPVNLRYTHIDGRVLNPRKPSPVAWYGDADFVPHFWKILRCRGIRVQIDVHPPIMSADFSDRKSLCKRCFTVMTEHADQAQ